MIRLSLRLSTNARDTQAIVQALRTLMRPARAEASCIRCELFVDAQSPELLLYIEEWSTPEELERQIRSERFSRLMLVMETTAPSPEMEFALVSETRGLEYVEAVRGAVAASAWAAAAGQKGSEQEP